MVDEWRKKMPEAKPDWIRLEAAIAALPEECEIPGYAATSAKNEVKFRLFAMFFFRYLEQSDFTLSLLRAGVRRVKLFNLDPASKLLS